MRKFVIVAASLAALAVPTVAIAAPGATANTTCTGDMSGQTINTNVTVPARAMCNLGWSDIKGNVSIAGTVVRFGKTTFEKNVSVVGGSFAAANWGVTINGNLSFVNPAVYSHQED